MSKTQKILVFILILVIFFSALWIFVKKPFSNEETNKNSTSTTTVSNTIIGNGTGYTITQEPIIPNLASQPDLSRAPFFDQKLNLNDNVKKVISEKILLLQNELKKNPSDFNSWIDLGMYYKAAGDYNAAVDVWKYAGQIAPKNFVSFGNLGDLSAYFLHDTVSAIKYYEKAITNGPTQSYLYIQLAEIYKDIEKDNVRAISVVERGLAQIPKDQNLLTMQKYLESVIQK